MIGINDINLIKEQINFKRIFMNPSMDGFLKGKFENYLPLMGKFKNYLPSGDG